MVVFCPIYWFLRKNLSNTHLCYQENYRINRFANLERTSSHNSFHPFYKSNMPFASLDKR